MCGSATHIATPRFPAESRAQQRPRVSRKSRSRTYPSNEFFPWVSTQKRCQGHDLRLPQVSRNAPVRCIRSHFEERATASTQTLSRVTHVEGGATTVPDRVLPSSAKWSGTPDARSDEPARRTLRPSHPAAQSGDAIRLALRPRHSDPACKPSSLQLQRSLSDHPGRMKHGGIGSGRP